MDAQFKAAFPNINNVAAKKTSEVDPKYNCIAWAFEDNTKVWWPNKHRCYWPRSSIHLTRMEAFQEWFAHEGWTETEIASAEAQFKRIALYALDGEPTHAARQLDDGSWTSKLGANIDLRHELVDLEGGTYGQVQTIYRKPK